MNAKRIMATIIAICMVVCTMSFNVFAEETTYVAKIGDVECADAASIISALQGASGDVTVEIYGKVETDGFGLNNPDITKLTFVAMSDIAEICVDGVSYIDIRYTEYPIEYSGLILSHINAGQNIDGFLPQYFSTYNGSNVTYTECEFPNGVTACGSTAGTTYKFTNCIFNNVTSGLYSLWIYGNSTNVIVEGGSFNGIRGIKLYSEGNDDFSNLTVRGATFSDTITEKHAIVLTKGESVTLEENTFNNTTGILQVDDDHAALIEGKSVIIDGTEYVVDSENLTLVEVTPEVTEIEIRTWDDLKELDAIVESGNMLEGVTVKLMNDIDLYEMGTEGEPVTFNPIGANTSYFKGTFDGQGHTIKNMYQSGWALGYDWYTYGTIGLFAYLWDATIKNLTIENAECFVEGGNVASVAGCAWGNCTFENVTVKNSRYATYNNRAAGIVGYTGGEGTMTFKNIIVDEDTVIAGLWGSFDSTLGGVVGSIQEPTDYVFEDVNVSCRLDCYNDVTASYKWYSYRMCGMLIGRSGTLFEGTTEVDPREQVVLRNVDITIGKWANYTYIWDDTLSRGCQRVEPGYAYDGIDVEDYPDAEITTQSFNTIIGGPQSQSLGYYGSSYEDLKIIEDYDTSTLTVTDLAYIVATYQAEIDGYYYETLEEAINNAQEDETVKLIKDITLDEIAHIPAGKKVILDLAGYTIDYADDWVYGAENDGTAVITVDFGGDLTIEDSSEEQTGTINGYDPEAENEEGAYRVYGAVMMTAYGDEPANGTAKLTVNGGTLIGTFAGIGGNRNRDNTEIIINGGTIKCVVSENYSSVGIEHPQNGKLTINGGYIEGMDGISLRSGTLLITGGTIKGTAPESAFENDMSGGNYWDNNFGTCTGHAIQIVSCENNEPSQETPSVSITGGIFSSENNDAVGSYASENGETPDTQIIKFITGGNFDSIPIKYLADGYELDNDGNVMRKNRSTGGGPRVVRYIVEFDSDGGTNINNALVVDGGRVVKPADPTKDGYVFAGWYTDEELTEEFDFGKSVFKSFTLYAKWTETPEVWFKDVKENDWFYEDVKYVFEKGLMNGINEETFAPNDNLTRAMLVTILYRNEGEPALAGDDANIVPPFADIDAGAYYASAVKWAQQNGIVNGVNDTEFAPDALITREQIATIMFRYAQYKGINTDISENIISFVDVNEISQYAVSTITWAVETGLIKGKSTTTINPKDNATRAEIAAILQRFIEN